MTRKPHFPIFIIFAFVAIVITTGCTDTGRSSEEWYTIGNTYLESGRFTEAIEAYYQALAENPDAGYAWNNRGSA